MLERMAKRGVTMAATPHSTTYRPSIASTAFGFPTQA